MEQSFGLAARLSLFGVDADDLAMVNLNLKETPSIELANFRYWSKQASFNVICTD